MIRRFTIKGFKRFEEPSRWCDAKEVFKGLRSWLQEQGVPLRIVEAEVIDAMAAVPADVQRVLRELQRIANPRTGRRAGRSTGRTRTASAGRAARA